MSKTLVSRIKPLNQNLKTPRPTSPFPLTPHTKKLVYETINILKTHSISQWQQSLQTLFADEETHLSQISHLVFDALHDVELGLKFFYTVCKQQQPFFSFNSYSYSSYLMLLARFSVIEEIELVLKNVNFEEVKPTLEAFGVVISLYADSGLIDKALELFYLVIRLYGCVPDILVCNALLNMLVRCKKVDIARKVYDEMLDRGVSVDNYSVCIIVRGLCKEGKVEEGKKLVENRWGVGCVPNTVFYNVLIDGYCKKSEIDSAKQLFKKLKMKGFLPTLETYGAMINGFCKGGDFKAVDRLLVEMKERDINVSVQV